jgi:hypothetical protein
MTAKIWELFIKKKVEEAKTEGKKIQNGVK